MAAVGRWTRDPELSLKAVAGNTGVRRTAAMRDPSLPAAAGQERPATLSTDRAPKSLLHSDTCRMIYFGNSAEAVVDDLAWQRLQCIGDRSLAGRAR